MTPALLDPAALAGAWIMSAPDARSCRLVLKATAAPDGQGLALELDNCVQAGLPVGQAANWRVSSDGLALAASDRSTVLFFSRHDDGGFQAKARDGRRITLTRAL